MDFFVRSVRITNSNRLIDRFLTAQIKLPDNTETASKGSIFCILEITNPWSVSSPIGNRVINTFIRSYYRPTNTNNAANFELAVKETNQVLGKITRNGQTNWIGNLNSVLAVINQNNIYLTQSGNTETYLYRDQKSNPIIEPSDKEELHPLKTFTNIVTGEVKNNDKILIASHELFDHITHERIKEIITSNNPYQAAEIIGQILKKEKTRNVNIIVLEINSKDEFAARVIEDPRETIYLDKDDLFSFWPKIKEYLDNLKPVASSIGQSAKKVYSNTKHFGQEKIIPQTSKIWENIKKSFSKKENEPKSTTTPKKTSSPEKPKSFYNIHHYGEKTLKTQSQFTKTLHNTWEKILTFLNKISTKLFDPKYRSYALIGIIIILGTILTLSIIKLRSSQTNKNELEIAQTKLTEAKNQYQDEAKLAILYNDNEKAQSILNNILTQCPNFLAISKISSDAENLCNNVQTDLDKITKTTRLKNSTIITSFNSVSEFVKINNDFFASSPQATNIEINTSSNNPQKVNFPTNTEKTKQITYLGDEKSILISSSSDEFYKLAANGSMERVFPIKGEWAISDEILTFYGNIYLLSKADNQIYKYQKSNNGYEQGSKFIKDDTNLNNVVSFAIDGSLYLLRQDGSVDKLSRGSKVDFSLNNLSGSDKLTNPKKIYTDSETTSLYILDNNRLIEFDKTGNYISQFAFPELSNITDFTINYETKEIYLLDSGKIFQYNY